MKAFTDYPFVELGDVSGEKAPVRPCTVLSYDGDKYCKIVVGSLETEIKAGYLYKTAGRFGEVEQLSLKDLNKLNSK